MQKPLVLIVEDDDMIAGRIAETLGGAGYPTAVTDTGEEAVRLVRESNPGLVLMDIWLKGTMDGIQAAGCIREHGDMPLIYLTAYMDDALIQRAKQTRPQAYLMKPFRPRELLATVEVSLHRHLLEKQQRELESRIQYIQKMKSLGTMAGAIAHHFNNILLVILGNAEMILEIAEPDPPFRHNVEEIRTACNKAKEITTQILACTGHFPTMPVAVDLKSIIREIGPVLELYLPQGSVIQYNLPPGVGFINADAGQIKQVVMNLVINAVESLGNKSGAITISTGEMDADHAFLTTVRPNNDLPAGRYAFLEVADNGCGMDANTLNQIFDPFFTTKLFGRGLGLSAVQGIVGNYCGGIKVQSRPQVGTTITILFPKIVRQQ